MATSVEAAFFALEAAFATLAAEARLVKAARFTLGAAFKTHHLVGDAPVNWLVIAGLKMQAVDTL